jgi:hypothetical protein
MRRLVNTRRTDCEAQIQNERQEVVRFAEQNGMDRLPFSPEALTRPTNMFVR